MKRTDFANLVLVSEEDLDNLVKYTTQGIKERFGALIIGYDSNLTSALSYYGIAKEATDLKFTGTEDVEYTNDYFTLQNGTAFTRFKEASDLTQSPYYDGGERLRVTSSQQITIHNQSLSAANYVYLVYVELKQNKKYDESGVNAYFVDRQDAWIAVQLTAAQVNTLGKFDTNPDGYVDITNVAAPYLDAELTNDEKTYTFGSWTSPGGIFTIGSIRVTHYNSAFLGKVLVTGTGPLKYKFYHTLSAADPIAAYTLARPSFSVVDNYHRNRFGNGTQSDENPHAQSIVDLDDFDNLTIDHRTSHHSNGITPKFTTSLECVIDGTTTPDTITVTSIAASEYLFLDGKRITSIANNFATFSGGDGAGTYYIYVQDSGTAPTITASSPWEAYSGNVNKGTSVPSNAYLLCSVYWDGANILKAYNGDNRYSAASTTNPVNDLRLFGVTGYDKVHNTILESVGRENLIPNGNFEIVENSTIKGWTTGTVGTLVPSNGSRCLRVPASASDGSLLFPLDSTNMDYSFRANLHTESAPATYQVSLIFYRGKNRTRDRVGIFTLKSEAAVTYSNWSLIESEFLNASTITWDNAGTFNDREKIGWASIEVSTTSGNIDFSSIVLRPKIRTYDLSENIVTESKIGTDAVSKRTINADVAGYGLDQHSDGSLKVKADETTLTVNTTSDTVEVKAEGIDTGHVKPTSEIGLGEYNGTAYKDTAGQTVGNALRIAFGGNTYYVPGYATAAGPGCGCTCACTCTCTCTCTCKGTSWN